MKLSTYDHYDAYTYVHTYVYFHVHTYVFDYVRIYNIYQAVWIQLQLFNFTDRHYIYLQFKQCIRNSFTTYLHI